MENSYTKNLSVLILSALFISTSGVLGKYIALPVEVIVWFRSVLAAIILFGYCKFKKINLLLKTNKDIFPFVLSAILMASHWILYFIALKVANVAIGMLSVFTFPIITTLLEPFFTKTKLNGIHVVLCFLVLLGVYILAPEFTLDSTEVKGILFGVASAVCYALRILILKQKIVNYNGTVLMFYQTLIITILLIPVLFFSDISNLESQFPYLLLIAILTTAIGHTLLVQSLKYFSVATASIIVSVQPIFGIIIAFLFVGEIPTIRTYIGGVLILITVVVESFQNKK